MSIVLGFLAPRDLWRARGCSTAWKAHVGQVLSLQTSVAVLASASPHISLGVHALVHSARSLRVLDLSLCVGLEDDALSHIAAACPALQEARLCWCPLLTPRLLSHFLGCARLRCLRLDGCRLMASAADPTPATSPLRLLASTCRELALLGLAHTRLDAAAVLAALTPAPALRCLLLAGCCSRAVDAGAVQRQAEALRAQASWPAEFRALIGAAGAEADMQALRLLHAHDHPHLQLVSERGASLLRVPL